MNAKNETEMPTPKPMAPPNTHVVGQKNVDATAMNENAKYEYGGSRRATDMPHAYRHRIAELKCERVRVIL